MGTRSGDVDAGAILHLIREDGVDPKELLKILNSRSGLAGYPACPTTLRDLLKAEAAGNERAALAIDAFCYRVRKYIVLTSPPERRGRRRIYRRYRRKLTGDPCPHLQWAGSARNRPRRGGESQPRK